MIISPKVADPRRLRRFVSFVRPGREERVLDIWLGSGLLALAFAGRAGEVVALCRDGPPRLRRRLARRPNLVLQEWPPDALELPFSDESFDLVTCGFYFHHLPDPAAQAREMWRVCRPGGRLALEEIVAHEQEVRARYQNRLERLRDRSHPGYFRLSELVHLLGEAGFLVRRLQVLDLQREFHEWLVGARPSPQRVEMMRRLLTGAQEADLSGLELQAVEDTFVFRQRLAWLVAERL